MITQKVGGPEIGAAAQEPKSGWSPGPVGSAANDRDYSTSHDSDYCSFQSGPLSGSALKIKHHHCQKIACPWNLVNLIMGRRVTSTDP